MGNNSSTFIWVVKKKKDSGEVLRTDAGSLPLRNIVYTS